MMKKLTPIVIFCYCFLFIYFTYNATAVAKKRCKSLQNKLHNIQAMQRQGYSLKRGESLRAKEDKARDKWWLCERSSLAKFNAKYGSKKNKAKKDKKAKKRKPVKSKRYYTRLNKGAVYSAKKIPLFNQGSAIVIRSKYEGNKHLAWLQFYSQPIQCQRPKNLSVFAYCSEDRREQQSDFDKEYRD